MTEPLRIPIILMTGFLGSGKTTLVNRLLVQAEMAHTIVFINEFGQISIDTDLITRQNETMIELSNGCVCCTLNEDLKLTLIDFHNRRAAGTLSFERVLIETTGLANAGPIIRTIVEDPQLQGLYTLDRVITTVDAVLGMKNLDLHAESVEQISVADCLVITKLDLIENQSALSGLRARLSQLNPAALQLERGRADVDISQLLSGDIDADLARSTAAFEGAACRDGSCHHDHHHHIGAGTQGRHDGRISSFCLTREKPVAPEALGHFWKRVNDSFGPNLLRVKGLVNLLGQPDQPIVVQGVQQLASEPIALPSWPSDDRRTRIVFIGWMLDQDAIEQMLPGA